MYEGEEKRTSPREFCSGHLEFSNTLCRIEERLIAVDKRINGSIESIGKHIDQGTKWRLSIIVAVALGLVAWGESKRQINVNTDRLTRTETQIERLQLK